jgi:predicted oxidoreductase
MKVASIALAIGLGISSVAHAQSFFSGNEVYQWCRDSARKPLCTSFIGGATDLIAAYQLANRTQKTLCVPRQADLGQVVDVVVAWLERHPAERHQQAASIVAVSLHEVWECR